MLRRSSVLGPADKPSDDSEACIQPLGRLTPGVYERQHVHTP
jgi:hypothetical protein